MRKRLIGGSVFSSTTWNAYFSAENCLFWRPRELLHAQLRSDACKESDHNSCFDRAVQPRCDACRESDHKSRFDRAGAEGLLALLVALPVSEWAPPGLPVQRQQALLLWHVALQEVHSRCTTLLCTSCASVRICLCVQAEVKRD